MRPLTLLPLALLAACVPMDAPDALPDDPGLNLGPDAPQASIRGLFRDGDGGPMYSGQVERFELEVDGAEIESVQWTASAGALWSDGPVVQWTVPPLSRADLSALVLTTEGEELEGTFEFPILWEGSQEWAVVAGATGQVDPTPDSISSCDLAIDGADIPHVAYVNSTHAQLWYGYFDGTTWQVELVDGPGFDVGGQVDDAVAIAVSASGQPHIAYHYTSNDVIRYATKVGSSWVREEATAAQSLYPSTEVGIALDPANGGRPTIAFSAQGGSSSSRWPAVTYRVAPGSWTMDVGTVLGGNSYNRYIGGMAFNSAGTAWILHDFNTPTATPWSAGGSWGTPTPLTTNDSTWGSVAIDGLGQPIVMLDSQMLHLIGSVWSASSYESSESIYFDLASDASGDPRFAHRHLSSLELGQLNAENYWLYTEADAMSSIRPAIAVDASDISHVAYLKSAQIWFW